jgi:hypothetical protein
MAQCEAFSIRSGGRTRCRREARDGTGACEYPEHQRQVAAARLTRSDPPERLDAAAAGQAEGSQEIPSPIDAGNSPQFQEAEAVPTWEALPATGELDLVSEIAGAISGGAAPPPPVERFEAAAGAALGVELEGADPFAIDQEQRAAREEIRSAVGDQVRPLADRFSAQQCERWIKILVAPKLARDGKPELTADEIQEGAQLASEWLQWVLGEWAVHSLPGRTAVWLSLVYGARYFENILGVAAAFGRFVRRRVAGAAAPPPAAAAPRAAEQLRDQDDAAAAAAPGDPWAAFRNPAFAPPPRAAAA